MHCGKVILFVLNKRIFWNLYVIYEAPICYGIPANCHPKQIHTFESSVIMVSQIFLVTYLHRNMSCINTCKRENILNFQNNKKKL